MGYYNPKGVCVIRETLYVRLSASEAIDRVKGAGAGGTSKHEASGKSEAHRNYY